MSLLQSLFGGGSYSIVVPVWASCGRLGCATAARALVYGAGNLGKFIGLAGRALIAGSSNDVQPDPDHGELAFLPGFEHRAASSTCGANAGPK